MKKLWLLILVAFLFVGTANAATFTVNSALDGSDVSPGNGICSTSINKCSLRAAIEEANAFAGTDTIAFAITGAGVKTIVPNLALPTITAAIIIDGWTQGGPGYTGSPLIEIDGTNAGAGVTGLTTTSMFNTFRGLAINRFSGNGISLLDGHATIQACYIGTDSTGSLDLGNGLDGIYMKSGQNTIGGTIAEYRNVISGNDSSGISINQGITSFASANIVRGNYIGTTASGAAAIPNGEHGIDIDGTQIEYTTIGGSAAGARNVISGNALYGIRIAGAVLFNNPPIYQHTDVIGNYIGTDASGSAALGNGSGGISINTNSSGNQIGGATVGERNVISGNGGIGVYGGIDIRGISTTGNTVSGNYIGTDAGGTVDLGNAGAGIWIDDASGNVIGGALAGEGNILAFNDYGVKMYELNAAPTDGNTVRGNSIFSNDNLGIDLFPLGVTANDTDDPDAGANNLQNFPVITGATTTGGTTTVQTSLNSTASTAFTIEFFSSATCDSSGNGEGETFIGSTIVTTDAGGDIAFTFTPASQVTLGRFVTATATRNVAPLNTSEFSECVQVVGVGSTVVINTNNSGAGSLRQAILDANATPGLDTITFSIAGAGIKTINLLSALPTVTDPVIINGTTQPGFVSLPLIELNGTGASASADGLKISAGGSTVRGLIINRFGGDGIELTSGGNTITGCFVGTDSSGLIDQGNGGNGILVSSADNRIGGANPSARNVISGNNLNGILISGVSATGNSIVGNIVGADVNRTADLGNSNNGVDISSAAGNVIGGASADFGNLISGNDSNGIRITTASDNLVLSNLIGTDGGGTADLGNTSGGVMLNNNATGNTIGGASGGNTIAFNSNGVNVVASATGNAMRGNAVFSSDNLGIDLFPVGVNANDTDDADTGANNKQNFPVLTSVFNSGGSTNIQGTLNSTPNTQFTIDFYSSQACDSSGNGEGEIFGGSRTVMTDGGGDVTFTFASANPVPVGSFITATATRKVAPLDTSEFSACAVVLANPGSLSFSSATYPTGENAVSKTIIVNRTGGSSGQITVDYAASNGTAKAGLDFTATSGTLTFLSGETTKSFEVFITDDMLDEPDETVSLRLSNPSFGVSLTPNASAVLTINDNDAPNPPSISITDVSLEEGNSGTTNYTFTINLSAPSGFDISVDYATGGGTATSGTDYVPASGTLDFSAASEETSKTVTVAVNGDSVTELNETFFVNLSNATGATIADNRGVGTIVDDDNPGRFSFTATPYSGIENTQVTITVSRTNGDAGTVSVDYSTSGGSATAASDYAPVSGTLVFGDGETTKAFTVNLLDDPSPEPTENFNVVLSNPIGGATLGTPSIAPVNILDNDAGTLLNVGGEILKTDGMPVVGATVNLTGAQTATTTTNSQGRYAFTNLAPNGTYSVTPSALGFTFNPISRQYSNLTTDITNANFTATAAPTRQLRIVGGNATPTQNITATVELVAQGDENSVGFSLNFNQNILINPQVVLHANASAASLIVNSAQAGAGKLGILLALPAGQSFTVGTKSLVTVTFNTTATNLYTSPVTFGNAPTVSQVANSNANPLPVNYLDGAVTFAQGWEADLVDRPTGTNNGTITVSDFTQVGRFAAGLDTNYQLNEFQRADCAPRESLGDGAVTVTDYTQAGLYAAGLNPAIPTGGQYAPRFFEFDTKGKLLSNEFDLFGDNSPTASTVVRVVNAQASPNTQVVVSIETIAQGTENGFGFTLNYNDAKLTNPTIELGSDIPANSALFPNTNTAGKIGVIIGLPFGQGLTAGTKQLVRIRFNVAAIAIGGETALTFADAPVVSEISDISAQRMQSTFQSGAVNILNPTAASVSVGGRVLSAVNRPVSGARVLMTDASGNTREARTNAFGFYNFAEVAAGASYIFSVTHKRYEFAPQVVFVSESVNELNFVSPAKLPFGAGL